MTFDFFVFLLSLTIKDKGVKQNDLRALKYYKKVEENQTDNSKLLLNISRTYYQLGKFQDARKLYEQVSIISPELARGYQYLGTKNEITSRASNAEEEGNVLWQE